MFFNLSYYHCCPPYPRASFGKQTLSNTIPYYFDFSVHSFSHIHIHYVLPFFSYPYVSSNMKFDVTKVPRVIFFLFPSNYHRFLLPSWHADITNNNTWFYYDLYLFTLSHSHYVILISFSLFPLAKQTANKQMPAREGERHAGGVDGGRGGGRGSSGGRGRGAAS